MECNICTEQYNLTTRKKIVCNCDFECCLKCIKTYHNENKKEPNCMNCNKLWTYEFIKNKLGESFIKNVYKQIKKEDLYKTELVLIPETQKRIEMLDKVKILNDEINELKRLIALKEVQKQHIYQEYFDEKRKEHKIIENIKCQTEKCVGFLNEDGFCSCCLETTCKKCLEKKQDNHECDKNIIESLKIIRKDSKKCPKCNIMIYKIDGCDQIFCTQCKILFDWKTLQIDTGIGHNPHYLEYMRENNLLERDQNEIRCGRELDIYLLTGMYRKNKINEAFYRIAYNVIHLEQVDLRKYRNNVFDNNLKYREKLIRKKITIEEFKDKIYNNYQLQLKNQEIYNILSTFIRCFTELIYNLRDTDTITLQETIEQIQKLRRYINTEFEKFSTVFKIKGYYINGEFKFVRR